jgi:hypothetical protein
MEPVEPVKLPASGESVESARSTVYFKDLDRAVSDVDDCAGVVNGYGGFFAVWLPDELRVAIGGEL